MRISIPILLILILNISIIPAECQNALPYIVGVSYASSFGAKGDGIHDDSKAIQSALDSMDRIGGGKVFLGSGTYLVSTIKLRKKTSLIGCGNGATIIKQIKAAKTDCVVIPAYSAALIISDLSIIGNDINNGMMIEKSGGGGYENHAYLFEKHIDNKPQPYKWITINNVCVYHFGVGLYIGEANFDINVCNSTFSFNHVGIVMKCSDSSIYNCYVTNNSKDRLYLAGSNNRICNIKSIWNGRSSPKVSAAINISGNRNQIINCETQDNYCKGYFVGGSNNLLSNSVSNTDGYAKEPKGYDPKIESCGFRINGLYNTFSNCAVTSYTDIFGPVYHSPVIVDKYALYYYPNIFDDIKILIPNNRVFFYEPLHNIQTLNNKNKIKNANIESKDGRKYFISSLPTQNVIKPSKC